jgi:molecular chaperone GrpE
MRRRAAEDVLKAGRFGAEKFANAMLPVKDSLEAALAAESADAAALRSGVELTLRQLQQAFSSANVEEVNPLGEKFDPHRHQAISQIEAPGEPNHVVQVLQKGYLLNERVLRPALVIVSKTAPRLIWASLSPRPSSPFLLTSTTASVRPPRTQAPLPV